MPPLSQLHPAIIHFPIALLLVAPLLVLAGLLWPAQRPGIHAAALALLVFGTAMAILAVITGLAAAGAVVPTRELLATLEVHERLAKRTALVYVALTLAFSLILVLPSLLRTGLSPRGRTVLCLAWLLASAGGSVSLVLTAHLGGRMVHTIGIRASGVARNP